MYAEPKQQPTADPRTPLADLLVLVAHGDRVVIADAAGCPVAVLLPVAQAAELERLRQDSEEAEDAAAIDAALAEQEASGTAPRSLEAVLADLDL